MKKIFSLLLALSLGLGASAAGLKSAPVPAASVSPAPACVATAAADEQAESTIVDLPLDDVFAYHYANEKFSKPGAYDYFFNYGNLADDGGFPWLMFHVLQPTDDGICAGTYSMADGTLRALILRSMDDYSACLAGETVNPLSAATVTIAAAGDDVWTMTFEGQSRDEDIIYRANCTLAIPRPSATQDTTDPLMPNGGGQEPDPDQPIIKEVVNIDINYGEVELWTNPQFSPEGMYDYYFQFVHLQDGATRADKWPFVDFDIYLPVKGKLQEGTYMFNDNFCNFALIQNNDDEQAYENFKDNYGFKSGSVTLTNNGEDNWTIEVEMLTEGGVLYLVTLTQDITLRWRDEDPTVDPGLNDTFNKESTTAGEYTVDFNLLDAHAQFVADRGFYYINLESTKSDEQGRRFVSEFFFRTPAAAGVSEEMSYYVPAGNYRVDYDDDSTLSFVASHGDGMSGGQYPSFIGLYDGKRITDIWYITQGVMTVSYDDEGELVLIGELESHYGSKLHITYNAGSVGLDTALVPSAAAGRKVLTDGVVTVRRNGHSYNIKGARVR